MGNESAVADNGVALKRVRTRIKTRGEKVAGVDLGGRYINLKKSGFDKRISDGAVEYKEKDPKLAAVYKEMGLESFAENVKKAISEHKNSPKEDHIAKEAESVGLGDYSKGVAKAIAEFRASQKNNS